MWIALCLSLLGLLLIYFEFFLPGGIVAVIGGLLVTAGITYGSLQEISLAFKALYFISNAILVALTCKLAIRVLKSREKNKFVLVEDQEEFVASLFDSSLVGEEGEVESDLKPSGYILVKGTRVQAISEGEYIPKGRKITVSGGRGSYLIVQQQKPSKEEK